MPENAEVDYDDDPPPASDPFARPTSTYGHPESVYRQEARDLLRACHINGYRGSGDADFAAAAQALLMMDLAITMSDILVHLETR